MSDSTKIMVSSKLEFPPRSKENTTEKTRWFPRFTTFCSWTNGFYKGLFSPVQGEPPLFLSTARKADLQRTLQSY